MNDDTCTIPNFACNSLQLSHFIGEGLSWFFDLGEEIQCFSPHHQRCKGAVVAVLGAQGFGSVLLRLHRYRSPFWHFRVTRPLRINDLFWFICPGSKIQALRIKDFKCFFTVLLFGQRSDPCHSQVEASANASSVELLRQCRVYDHEFSRPESVIFHLGRGQICRIFLIHVHRPSEQCSKPCVVPL